MTIFNSMYFYNLIAIKQVARVGMVQHIVYEKYIHIQLVPMLQLLCNYIGNSVITWQ
jgi:hypothetical protein